MQSIWEETQLPKFPTLDGDRKTDVLIIGGGMAGILITYYLHQSGVDCLLVEKGRICGGNTRYTTAKITAQHGLVYHKLLRSGEDVARRYLRANLAALAEYERLCADIPCTYTVRDNYVYSADARLLEREMRALETIGYDAEFCRTLPIPVKASGAVRFARQAQFDPLKFVAGIASGLPILENTFVREMIGTTAVTERGIIRAKNVICATHFPFISKHGSYFLKLYQSRSYVIALEGAKRVEGMYVSEREGGLSFRSAGEYLLLGGGGGRTGKACESWDELRRFAKEHYPDARETHFWAAQDCMSLDGRAYIGKYSARTSDFYVATGFNKWGMTLSMVAAMLLRDRILGHENELAEVFDPSRSILKPQLFKNSCEAAVGLLSFSGKRCPHMGCALKWNAAEHTWDCPCHGSRFTRRGRVLDNPANGDKKV